LELSVILPAYNGERFIQAAIDSVLSEPRVRQLIVVDDASDDSTLRLVQFLARSEPRIEITRLSSNQGVAAARNRGVSLARFDWLGFIDQDDLWEPARTSALSSILENSQDSIALGRVSHFVDDEVADLAALRWARPEWTSGSHEGWVVGAMLLSAKTFARVGPFNESFRSGTDDLEWFTRVQQRGAEILHAPDVVLKRRLHLANESGSSAPDVLSIVRSHLASRKGKD
jgi:glycosyltransferase involved in cell wall biosynthesis